MEDKLSIYRKALLLLITTSFISCGGGGSGNEANNPIPSTSLVFSTSPLSFSLNEDASYSGQLTASVNKNTTLTFSISQQPDNGYVDLSPSGSFTYNPLANFNGSDSFSFRVSAENSTSTSEQVSILINPVNDAPVVEVNDGINKKLLVNSNNKILVPANVSDVDNEIADLNYSLSVEGVNLPIIFLPSEGGLPDDDPSSFEIDISLIEEAGYFSGEISSGELEQDCSFASFSTFFVSGLRTEEDYTIYNLLGSYNSASNRGTSLLIIADSLDNNTEVFRNIVSESIRNLLVDSEVTNFFKDHFNIFVVEPSSLSGTEQISFVDMNLGECVDWSDNIFCWDTTKLKTLKEALFPDVYIDSIAFFSNLGGRGVTSYDYGLPPTTAQHLSGTTYQTFMHELGHSHALLGDEYINDDGQEYSSSEANYPPNTTTTSDVYNLKWNHWISDLTSVPGLHSMAGQDGVGLFEGTYYGDTGTYRPKANTAMNNKEVLKYGEVSTESFAIVSTQNQFSTFLTKTEVLGEENAVTGFKIALLGKFDSSKIRIEWYENGINIDSLTNQIEVTFSRPTVDEIKRYTWKAIDLTEVITVNEDPLNINDCYEGVFDWNSLFYSWNGADWDGPVYNPEILTSYDYGMANGPLGGSWFINWSLW
jgi:hypothetical protein